MAVYVDDMRAKFGRLIMCHMIADTDAELHAMAARIGVARRWFQCPPKASNPHYDIALSKRALAAAAGAVQITWRQAGAMCALRRDLCIPKLPAPGDAEEMLRGLRAWRRRMVAPDDASCQQGKPCGDPNSCPNPVGCGFEL